ncbi:ATP-binding protein [Malacoplasma muris]|uniref:ATP-binding protein n=1 Tax=Malacoplasma muris TaxID=2119 RepID=UPI00398EC870
MQRVLINKLIEWKNNNNFKPLILEGARQVGKTWLILEFSKKHFDDYIYINFESDSLVKSIFNDDLKIDKIIEQLSIHYNKEIDPNKTIIILDEIQECSRALTSLKYFCEHNIKYRLIASGSLLRIASNKGSSFPVGKIELLHLYPMTFSEFLLANNEEKLLNYLNTINSIEKIPELSFNKLKSYLEIYYITGGMPESIKTYLETKDLEKVQKVLSTLILFYKRDFIKYLDGKDINRINTVFESLPTQLSKKNKKFSFKVMKENARAREYIDSIQWLTDIHLIYKIYKNNAAGLPIKNYQDNNSFKLYMCDIGLLNNMFNVSIDTLSKENNEKIAYFKGSITDNFILQSLINLFDQKPYYWSILNPSHEVDFLIEYKNNIIPIEVKSNENIKSKSLNVYKEKYKTTTILRIRFSMQNICLDGDVLNIPIFLVDKTNILIDLALNLLKSN